MKFSSWSIICFGQKEPIKVPFSRLLSVLVKVHPISHTIFETTRSGFIQTLHHCPVSRKTTLLYFSGSNFVHFGQPESIEKKFSDFCVVGWEFVKFVTSYLKPQVSFSLNFASLFNVMRDNSSVHFYVKLYMIWTKWIHQSAIFQTSDCPYEILPNLYFDSLLLLKVYNISAKKA